MATTRLRPLAGMRPPFTNRAASQRPRNVVSNTAEAENKRPALTALSLLAAYPSSLNTTTASLLGARPPIKGGFMVVRLPSDPLRRGCQTTRFCDLLAVRPSLQPRLAVWAAAKTRKNGKTVTTIGVRRKTPREKVRPVERPTDATPPILGTTGVTTS